MGLGRPRHTTNSCLNLRVEARKRLDWIKRWFLRPKRLEKPRKLVKSVTNSQKRLYTVKIRLKILRGVGFSGHFLSIYLNRPCWLRVDFPL